MKSHQLALHLIMVNGVKYVMEDLINVANEPSIQLQNPADESLDGRQKSDRCWVELSFKIG